MDIGQAIAHLKEGHKISRRDFPIYGTYLYFVPANSYLSVTDIAKENGDTTWYAEYIALRVPGCAVTFWSPNQSDILANDWFLV